MADDKERELTPEEEYDAAFTEFLAAAEDDEPSAAAEESEEDTAETTQEATASDETKEAEGSASEEIDWSQVPEAYRQAYEAAVQQAQEWQHRYQSDQGRILAAQRRLAELSQQQQQQASQSGSQAENDSAPVTDEEVRKATGMEPERWRQLKEELPEVAEALESYIQSVRSEYDQKLQQVTQQIESRLEPIQQIEQERYIEAQLQMLSQQHPDWREIATSEEFAQWLNTQPTTVRTLAGSQDANEVSFVLTAYKAAKGLATGGESSGSASAIQQTRKQIQQRAATPELKRKVAAPSSGIPDDDYDAAWEYFARES